MKLNKSCAKVTTFCLFLHLSENIFLSSLLLNNKLYASSEREKHLESKMYIALNVCKDVTEDDYVRAMHFLMDPNSQPN